MSLGDAIADINKRTASLEEALRYCRMRAEEIVNWEIEDDDDRAEVHCRANAIVLECDRMLADE
jgi:hypothetical protein